MKIGIVGSVSNDKFGVNAVYAEFVANYLEATPYVVPPVNNWEELLVFDMVLLPGGADVSPTRYAAVPSFMAGRNDPLLEHFDQTVLPHLLGNVPIFGICRGFQSLHVALGGKLTQHLWLHPTSNTREHLVHEVVVSKRRRLKVNSLHHQGAVQAAPEVTAVGWADDGVLEAFIDHNRRVAAVQWHPEEIRDWFTPELIFELLGR